MVESRCSSGDGNLVISVVPSTNRHILLPAAAENSNAPPDHHNLHPRTTKTKFLPSTSIELGVTFIPSRNGIL